MRVPVFLLFLGADTRYRYMGQWSEGIDRRREEYKRPPWKRVRQLSAGPKLDSQRLEDLGRNDILDPDQPRSRSVRIVDDTLVHVDLLFRIRGEV